MRARARARGARRSVSTRRRRPRRFRLFITAVEFLPTRQTLRTAADGDIAASRKPRRSLAGPAADSMATIVALFQDQTIRLYQVPFPLRTSGAATLLSLAAQLLLVYLLAYFFFNY